MKPNRDLQRVLRDTPLPGETEAEEQAWDVVRTAYAERSPMPSSSRGRRLALVLAAGMGLLAIGLSPAGAKVEDLVSDVVGIGDEHAKPALRMLPAAGELLVDSDRGPWIVREDGSKRLLGAYGQATWSPRGLFVAATDGRELVAVDPTGQVRWTITAPGPVRDPRWSPSGFRIAYRSGDDLRVVAGDGTDERLIARDVAPVPPAWRPIRDSKLAAAPGDAGSHVLTYVDDDKHVGTVDVDTGRTVQTTPRDFELLSTPPAGTNSAGATSPDGRHLARITYRRGREQLELLRDGGHQPQVLFSTPGRLTGPTWSPDGHWLLVGLAEADQWLFIRTDRPGRVIAFDGISEQFDPGARGEASFPRVAGWILPPR